MQPPIWQDNRDIPKIMPPSFYDSLSVKSNKQQVPIAWKLAVPRTISASELLFRVTTQQNVISVKCIALLMPERILICHQYLPLTRLSSCGHPAWHLSVGCHHFAACERP